MKAEVEAMVGWASLLLRLANYYLSFYREATLALVYTFPFNVLAVAAFALLLFRAVRQGRAKEKEVVRLVQAVALEVSRGRQQLVAMESRRIELSAEVQKMRERLAGRQAQKFDEQLVEELEAEEERLYQAYLKEIRKDEISLEEVEIDLEKKIEKL
jgi:TolA-binding protein